MQHRGQEHLRMSGEKLRRCKPSYQADSGCGTLFTFPFLVKLQKPQPFWVRWRVDLQRCYPHVCVCVCVCVWVGKFKNLHYRTSENRLGNRKNVLVPVHSQVRQCGGYIHVWFRQIFACLLWKAIQLSVGTSSDWTWVLLRKHQYVDHVEGLWSDEEGRE